VEACPVEACPVEACPVEACPEEACPVEACPEEACPVEACPEEACLAEACPDGACLAAEDNKGNFLEAEAYVFQGKAVAASVQADNIEHRRVAVASCRAWAVDLGAEVSVRGAAGRHFAVAVVFVAVAAALISGARDKVAFED
jgi:hypothetical protein